MVYGLGFRVQGLGFVRDRNLNELGAFVSALLHQLGHTPQLNQVLEAVVCAKKKKRKKKKELNQVLEAVVCA